MHTPRSKALPHRHPCNLAVLTLAALLALGAIVVPMAFAGSSKTVVSEGKITDPAETVLTTVQGRTLYSLSIEKNGKFSCTAGCLYTWKPLTIPAGTTPKGPVKLGTVKRPEGKTQVTFKGHPLYTFYGDKGKGQANGEGVDDVGTWHAVTP